MPSRHTTSSASVHCRAGWGSAELAATRLGSGLVLFNAGQRQPVVRAPAQVLPLAMPSLSI